MRKEEVKKMLSEQLELLAQRSKNCTSDSDLCRLTSAMVEILASEAWFTG